MKATTVIIAAILTLQVNVLLAGNDITSVPVTNENNTIILTSLAPTTPNEATFEDEATFDINQLMPVVPAEASFEDMSFEMVSVLDLTPVTPVAADFEDENDLTINLMSLAPLTPAEADFE